MTERKFKSYTLWLKWPNLGWKPECTCLNLPWPAANPRNVLSTYMGSLYGKHWERGKNWMILPENRKPPGVL
jgi:hypothetical protein